MSLYERLHYKFVLFSFLIDTKISIQTFETTQQTKFVLRKQIETTKYKSRDYNKFVNFNLIVAVTFNNLTVLLF